MLSNSVLIICLEETVSSDLQQNYILNLDRS